jgi:hypothetical protein
MSFQFFGMWRKSIPNWRWWITSPFWCVTFLFVTTTRSYFNRAFLIWLLGTPQKSSAGWNVSRPWPRRFESFWFERRHKYWKHLNLLSLLSANVLHTLRGGSRERKRLLMYINIYCDTFDSGADDFDQWRSCGPIIAATPTFINYPCNTKTIFHAIMYS